MMKYHTWLVWMELSLIATTLLRYLAPLYISLNLLSGLFLARCSYIYLNMVCLTVAGQNFDVFLSINEV